MPSCPICQGDHEFNLDDAGRQRRYRRLNYEDPSNVLREFPIVRLESGGRRIAAIESTPGREPPERIQGALFAWALTLPIRKPSQVAFGPRKDLDEPGGVDCVVRQHGGWRRPVQLKGLASTNPAASLQSTEDWIRNFRGVRDMNVVVVVNCGDYTLQLEAAKTPESSHRTKSSSSRRPARTRVSGSCQRFETRSGMPRSLIQI